jgi:DNA-binding beta-propeller fold protein YncE
MSTPRKAGCTTSITSGVPPVKRSLKTTKTDTTSLTTTAADDVDVVAGHLAVLEAPHCYSHRQILRAIVIIFGALVVALAAGLIHHKPVPRPRRARGGKLRSLAVTAASIAIAAGVTAGPAAAERLHAFEKTIATQGTGAGQLELAAPVPLLGGNGGDEKGGSGLAVNNSTHDIYVADTNNHRVDEYAATGGFIRAFGYGVLDGKAELETCTATCRPGIPGSEPGQLETPLFIAIDNSPGGEGDIYVADSSDNTITKYTSEGKLMAGWNTNGQLTSPPTETFIRLNGIAVSDIGNLWVAAKTTLGNELIKYEQSGAYTTIRFAAEAEPCGLTVNPAEELYVANGFPDVGKFTAAGTEVGELFPEGGSDFTGLAVDETSNVLYLDREDAVLAVSGSCPPPEKECKVFESFGAPQLSGGAGVAVDPETDVVFVANTATDVVDVFPLEPVAPPLVTGGFTQDVTATGATLGGEVDPRSLPEEPETEYYFEYGECQTPTSCPTSNYLSTTPAETLTASFDASSVSADVEGLTPGRTYHYRLVAANTASRSGGPPGEGEEVVFKTQGAGVFKLADDRQWELVSPVDKYGALIEPIGQEGVIQAAANGNAITYHANQATEPDAEGAMNEVQILSTRTSSGWSTRDIEPSHGLSGKPEGEGEPYRFFSENLAFALLQPAGAFEPGLYPEASEQTPLLRTNYLANTSQQCIPREDDCYKALVTTKPPYANVPAETHFGEAEVRAGVFGPCPQASIFCGPELVGASPDGQHPVFRSYAQLTSQETPPNSGGELYEWNHGTLALVSILPDGEVPADAQFGFLQEDTRHAVSADGSRVVFSSAGTIYVRDTNPVSSGDPEAETTTAVGGGEFQDANSETTKIFFTTGGNLYEYTIGTSEPVPLTEKGKVLLGAVVGVSQSGEYVYFVANSTLRNTAEGAVAGDCKGVQSPGQLCNLYVEHNGVTRLIAVLSGEDHPDWAKESLNLTELTARVSPDGQYLAFMSDRNLVGYDTADTVSGHADEEVYLYDAKSGRLVCASCDPTGARPHGHYYFNGGTRAGGQTMRLVGGSKIWEPSSSLAANIPGWTPYDVKRASYQSRYLTDEGRLFFNSYGGLVPKDTNGNWDVYEYEPENVGPENAKCGPEAADGAEVYKTSRAYTLAGRAGEEPAGCVALISSGSSTEESAFLDASETGSDVFFLTTAKLSPQDTDNAYDIYTAHECLTSTPCPQQAAETQQEAEACANETECRAKGPTPRPTISGGATTSPTGEHNQPATPPLTPAQKLTKALKTCRTRYPKAKKHRHACEQTARHHYAPAPKKHTKKQRR